MAGKHYHYLKMFLLGGILFSLAVSPFSTPHKIHLHRIDVTRLPDVHVYFTVVDAQGECILGLSASEMELFIDKQEQAVSAVESALAGQEYLAVVLLFDRSGSVKSALDQAKAAALDFVQRLNRNDKVAVISWPSC